jgi:hypothetical protein
MTNIILLVISHIVVFGGGYLLGVKPELEEIKKEGTD